MAFKFTLNFEPMLCELIEENISRPVSYTHLTLPTILRV